MVNSTTDFVNVSWTYKNNIYYPKVMSFICGIKLSNLQYYVQLSLLSWLIFCVCLCVICQILKELTCVEVLPQNYRFGGLLLCFQDVLGAFHFPYYIFWCQKLMFLLSGYWNEGYKYPSLIYVMLVGLEFPFIWYSYCYTSFLLFAYPCSIFAYLFIINFIVIMLYLCSLYKAYLKLIVHYYFFHPLFPLKTFVLISFSLGRSSPLNNFLRLHECFSFVLT